MEIISYIIFLVPDLKAKIDAFLIERHDKRTAAKMQAMDTSV
jgi:ubiquitin conjugation factor E4 B